MMPINCPTSFTSNKFLWSTRNHEHPTSPTHSDFVRIKIVRVNISSVVSAIRSYARISIQTIHISASILKSSRELTSQKELSLTQFSVLSIFFQKNMNTRQVPVEINRQQRNCSLKTDPSKRLHEARSLDTQRFNNMHLRLDAQKSGCVLSLTSDIQQLFNSPWLMFCESLIKNAQLSQRLSGSSTILLTRQKFHRFHVLIYSAL